MQDIEDVNSFQEAANRYFVHYDKGSDSFYTQEDAFKGAKKLEDEGYKILDVYYQVDENDAEGLNKEYQDFKRKLRRGWRLRP